MDVGMYMISFHQDKISSSGIRIVNQCMNDIYFRANVLVITPYAQNARFYGMINYIFTPRVSKKQEVPAYKSGWDVYLGYDWNGVINIHFVARDTICYTNE